MKGTKISLLIHQISERLSSLTVSRINHKFSPVIQKN